MSVRDGAPRLAAAILAAAWILVLSSGAVNADEGWTIDSFGSDITIAPDSTITVKEQIAVNFGSLQKHGIFRTIPLRYRFDNTHDRYFVLTVKSVTNGDSTPLMQSDYVQNDNQVIQIGDPNVTVSGLQIYVITYTVRGAMNSFNDHDELFWNVDGALWGVPKTKVFATVHLPSPSLQKAACYQGAPGSTEACRFETTLDSVAFTATRPLASGEELSVVTGLNKGAVAVPPPLLEPRQRQFPQDAFDLTPVTGGIAGLLTVLGVGLVAWNWWTHGRDRAYLKQYYLTNDPRQQAEPLFKHEPLVVEFEPPGQMRPAELGLILDERADAKDVTATIIDLAVRGHLTITEVPGGKDWTLEWKAGDVATLQPFEKTILEGLFAGRTKVALSELKTGFRPTLNKAENQLYEESVTRKLFTHRPDFSRWVWAGLGVAVLLVGVVGMIILGVYFGWGLVAAPVALVGLLLIVSFPFMTQRTAAGRELMQHTLGFRLYMTTAEKYRQQFAAKAEIFTQLLPYAIVFGCVTMWAKAFEGIDTSATNTWYYGGQPFQAALLAGSLQSLNAGISSAITYVPPSSGGGSGFGGGGFSGGGFGGGGGGSW